MVRLLVTSLKGSYLTELILDVDHLPIVSP